MEKQITISADIDFTDLAARAISQVSDVLIDMLVAVFDPAVIVAVLATLTLTQLFKAAVKHYTRTCGLGFDGFTRKMIVFLFAFVIGFAMTMVFVEKPDIWKWAFGVAIFNPLVYKILLFVAQWRQWIRVEALMKMKNIKETEFGPMIDDSVIFTEKACDKV